LNGPAALNAVDTAIQAMTGLNVRAGAVNQAMHVLSVPQELQGEFQKWVTGQGTVPISAVRQFIHIVDANALAREEAAQQEADQLQATSNIDLHLPVPRNKYAPAVPALGLPAEVPKDDRRFAAYYDSVKKDDSYIAPDGNWHTKKH
jgi:hypothetical protein